MRAVIVILVIILVLGLVGWVKFGTPDGDPAIQVDTDKVKQDTAEVFEKTNEAVNSVTEKIDASIDREPVDSDVNP